MFNKMRQNAQAQTMAKLKDSMGPEISQHIEKIKSLSASDVENDETYTALVVKPLLVGLQAMSGGMISLAENHGMEIKAKLTLGMFRVRDQLMRIDAGQVTFDPEFNNKIVPTLIAAIQQ